MSLSELFLDYATNHGFNYDNARTNVGDWLTAPNLNKWSFNSSIATCKHLYFSGLVVRHDEPAPELIAFLKPYAINIRQQDQRVVVSGTFEFTRELVQQYLIEHYGSLLTAYTEQAAHCKRRYEQNNDSSELKVASFILLLVLELDVDEQLRGNIYQQLGDHQMAIEELPKALSYYYRAYALYTASESHAQLKQVLADLQRCQQRLTMNAQNFLNNDNLRVISTGDVSIAPGVVSTGTLFFISGILLRASGISRSTNQFLQQRDVQVAIEDNVVMIQGAWPQLRAVDVINFIREEHGDPLRYFLTMAHECIDQYFQTHISAELDCATWFLHRALELSSDPLQQPVIYFIFARLAQAQGDPYLAMSMYQLAIKSTGNSPDYLQNMNAQLDEGYGVAQALWRLCKHGLINQHNLRIVCAYPKQAAIIRSALLSLKRAGKLNDKTQAAVCAQPKSALWIAYQLGGVADKQDNVIKDFAAVRYVGRWLLLGSRSEESSLTKLPTEVAAKVAQMAGDGAMDEESAYKTGLLSLEFP